jgi:hypothetical protein
MNDFIKSLSISDVESILTIVGIVFGFMWWVYLRIKKNNVIDGGTP